MLYGPYDVGWNLYASRSRAADTATSSATARLPVYGYGGYPTAAIGGYYGGYFGGGPVVVPRRPGHGRAAAPRTAAW